ncbi:transporter substrate-binding domain-containing protein [Pontibacillus yanchengensis]|uniref:Transporter substrate-binding domain-containing protein n=1 Tax=Pontibacillus yanchengensis TaxID=462910 RepID=A0A6I5A6J2_9BACI|nr:transporter substrate-binding domain-containing protein [Pontibacillus yanchengensis]MYL36005.1 transporter substrate-binding domain-containing protein [Pontibacillus yanchengensis]
MKKVFTLVIALLSFSLLVACGTSGDSASGEGGEGGEKETYTVATDANFKPFEFKDPETGEMKGFDIELMKAIADEAGFNVEFKSMQFDGLITGMQSGRFPLAIAGISITEERKESIAFSDPYYDSGVVLMVNKDNSDIQSIDDVDGVTVGTKTGSTSESYLTQNTDAEVKAFPDIINAYMDVKTGRLDAALYDLPNVKYYIKQSGEGKLKTVGDVLEAQSYGIALPKESELVDDVNKALQAVKDNGTYDEIYEKYFGSKPE